MRPSIYCALLLSLLPTVARAEHDICDAFGSPEVGSSLTQGDGLRYGLAAQAQMGRSVAFIGDFDGDGMQDVAVGVPGDNGNGSRAGAVELFLSEDGPLQLSGAPSIRIRGAYANDKAGSLVQGVGDLDGDGYDDLLIGGVGPSAGHNAGVAWIVRGGANRPSTLNLRTQATAELVGAVNRDGFATSASGLGDVNGDGFGDLVIGAPGADPSGESSGAAFVFYGPLTGRVHALDADVILKGEDEQDLAGTAVSGVGDVDGDGVGDLVVGAPGNGPALMLAGAAYVVSGATLTPGARELATAGTRIHGTGSERFGSSVSPAGDVDDDGLQDFWVGARLAFYNRRGAVALFAGGDVDLGDVEAAELWKARIGGASAGDLAGTSVAGGVDLNADGHEDVVIGANMAGGVDNPGAGAAFAALGPFDGETRLSATEGAFSGNGASWGAGHAVSVAPDVNGDGFGDWLVGAPGAAVEGLPYSGAVGLFYGGHDVTDLATWYRDTDHDGWGDEDATVSACVAPPYFAATSGDCNDASAAWHPYAVESNCSDPNDYNCDGSVGMDDLDLDGWAACQGDCADGEARIRPDADEACFDGLDNDCDTLIDDASAVDAQDWRPDGDGDGFGATSFVWRSCAPPAFFLKPPVTVGGDCDDYNLEIRPGRAEVCDSRDNDCDGSVDEDALDASDWFGDHDHDGFGMLSDYVRACAAPSSYVANYEDCDDLKIAARPGQKEWCNFEDDDCDGLFYRGGHLAAGGMTWAVDGNVSGFRFGQTLARVPDTDGDGDEELAVAAFGDVRGAAVYVGRFDLVSGRYDWGKDYGDGIGGWQLRVTTTDYNLEFGKSLAGGDFDGDGIGDLAIGAPSSNHLGMQDSGIVYVFYGPFDGRDATLADADAVIYGAHGGDRLGDVMVSDDLDGDGKYELLMSAWSLDDAAGESWFGGIAGPVSRRGGAFVLHGTQDRSQWHNNWMDDEARVLGLGLRDEAGRSIAVLGDIDHDGLKEIAVGAPKGEYLDTGYVLIAEPTLGQVTGVIPPIARVYDSRINSQLAFKVGGGDINGDGLLDMVVSNAQSDVYVIYGTGSSWPSGHIADLHDVLFDGPTNQELGNSLLIHDVDHDGKADVVIGAPTDDDGGWHAGAVYILYGSNDLPEYTEIENIESQGRVDYGTTEPVFSFQNSCTIEGAKLVGSEAGAEYGYAVIAGLWTGVGPAGDVVSGAPGFRGATGAVEGWTTGEYGSDWKPVENPELVATKVQWWPDNDLDGTPDPGPGEWSCEMHIPEPCQVPTTRPLCDPNADSDHDGINDCFDAEWCDGVDNDGNGLVDEGYDSDEDGEPDCFDVEECDGLDNNGDGWADEDFDVDLDGVADCFDVEECDGVDNDADHDIDEGFDIDFDGTADCGVELCDGVDNDSDELIDEGFDRDLDGLADCFDEEQCDGIDNDGDGLVDEGFDNDSDEIANCFDVETCDGVDNDGDGQIDEWFDADNDGVADCYDDEQCDGFDNDGDGAVDEGFDSDGDGLGDCFDTEQCDGVDNDGDGLADEGFDSDGDTIADCFDTELCDGMDNDGDVRVDEGFDSDGDGLADCFDTEQCDGADNDGDAQIDEGFDADHDGMADCFDWETCDAVDNDGDGLVDEGFDADNDDLADCFDAEQCDGLDNDGDGVADEGFDSDGDRLADCYDTEVCDGVDNDGDAQIDEGFNHDGDALADCFDTEECDGLDNDGDGQTDEGFDSDDDDLGDCFDTEVCDGVDNDGDGLVDEGLGNNDTICEEEHCNGIDDDLNGLVDDDDACPDEDGLCEDDEENSYSWWEAHALGWAHVDLFSNDAAGVQFTNTGDAPIRLTEQLLFTSQITQSMFVDQSVLNEDVLPGAVKQMYYGSGTTPNGVWTPRLGWDAWWCVELGLATVAGAHYELFGEVAPQVLTNFVNPGVARRNQWGGGHGVRAQYDIWNWEAAHPVLTVGKVLQEVSNGVEVQIPVRNLGAIVATGTIQDFVPNGWHAVSLPPGWTATPATGGRTLVSGSATPLPAVNAFILPPTWISYVIAPNDGLDWSKVDVERASINFTDSGVARNNYSLPASIYGVDIDNNGYVDCKAHD